MIESKKRVHTESPDALLVLLRRTLEVLPTDAQSDRITRRHQKGIRASLGCRGSFFCRSDEIILEVENSEQIRIPVRGLPAALGSSIHADGRASSSFAVRGKGVSRLHCELTRNGPFITLRDKGSKNGTYLNGKPIEEESLCEGDRVSMGEVEFVVKRG